MANLPSDLAAAIADAKVAGAGDYIVYGEYVSMIYEWKYQKVQDACVILELMPVESKKKVVMEGDKRVEQEPNAPGSLCNDIANFDGNGKMSAPANSQAPVIALYAISSPKSEVEKSVVKKTLKQALKTDEDGDPDLAGVPIQPARGMLIGYDTHAIKTQAGKYICRPSYYCINVPGQGVNAPDKVAARVQALRSSREEALKVALEHLTEARAKGLLHVAGASAASGASTAGGSNGATAAATGGPPAIPGAGAPPLTDDEKITAGGWHPHPTDKTNVWYWKEGYPRAVKREEILAGKV